MPGAFNLLLRLVAAAEAIQADLAWFRTYANRPVRLLFLNPETRRPMSNFEAMNDTNYAIPIVAANAVGQDVPLPSADTFTANWQSSAAYPGLFAVGTLSDGSSPALLINSAGAALLQGEQVTVSDADGLTVATLTVDVVEDLNPRALMLDVADAQATVVQPTAATVPGGATNTPSGAAEGTTEPPAAVGAAASSRVGISSNTGQPVPAAPAKAS